MKKGIAIILSIISVLMFFFTVVRRAYTEISTNLNSNNFDSFGDFLYEEVKPVNSTNNNESYIRIMGLSDEGKTKEIIIIPQYINNIQVKEIGRRNVPKKFLWKSENLKRIYIPFKATVFNVFSYCYNLKRVLMLADTFDEGDDFLLYITSFNHKDGSKSVGTNDVLTQSYANVSYFYNYAGSPHNGYYWIDDYKYGTKISYIPDNPIRTGFIFDGWYKEKECINRWNFDIDTLPEVEYYATNAVIYQETKLYAKWNQEN